MKLAMILLLALTGTLASQAAPPPGKKAQRQEQKEQKASLKELREKYDVDKDGKLSKDERAAISAEDKAKLEKFKAERKKEPKKSEPKKPAKKDGAK